MLQPADVLLLDEPTNDLDIPTLEILEESLLEFRGSLVLVTHDRYMLDRVSNIVLGLDGQGGAESFADYSQWESWQAERKSPAKAAVRLNPAAAASAEPSFAESASTEPFSTEPSSTKSRPPAKRKLAYLEAREYAGMEQRIADTEQVLQAKRAQLEDPAIASDGPRLLAAHAEMEAAQKDLDALYARWAELEEKNG
jgi:ATP-binding cassette subfamily F protein uup